MAETILTTRQHKALSALLTEPTIAKAAESAGIAERTLYLWLADATFVAAYRAARREAVRHAITQLQRAAADAVKELIDLMKDGPPAIRFSAASKVLELAAQGVELDDVLVRVEALEAAAKAKQR